MRLLNLYIIVSFPFFLFFSACQKTSSNNQSQLLLGLAAVDNTNRENIEAAKQCETGIDNNSTFDIAKPIQLCRPLAGSAQHFRFENVSTIANNGFMNLLVGYGERSDVNNFPTAVGFGGGSASATTQAGDGRWRIFFGKSQSCDKALVDIRFSGINNGVSIGNGFYGELFTTQAISTPTASGPGCIAQNSGVWGPSTICMDISKGESGSSPRITVWINGRNGANCLIPNSLTKDNAVYEKRDWSSLVPTKEDRNYIYRNLDGISVHKVVVRSETAIR